MRALQTCICHLTTVPHAGHQAVRWRRYDRLPLYFRKRPPFECRQSPIGSGTSDHEIEQVPQAFQCEIQRISSIERSATVIRSSSPFSISRFRKFAGKLPEGSESD